MCIADNSCSISTDHGDFNSTSLSQSVLTSLGPHPWRFKPIYATIIDGPYSSDTAFLTNLDTVMDTGTNAPVQQGMEINFPDSTPNGQTSFVQFFDGAEVDTSTAISADTGDRAVFSRPNGLVSCSLFNIPEFVQSKDRENACVDFLQIFVSSGSDQGLPTTHIFTDDGFDFTVTSGQELLQWQGGWTNQNGFVPANQLGIGYKLVSWQNDIYQYVQITSMSFEENNAIGVNFLTTGTNSYQLKNGIVVRGFVDDYCSCSPSASINDFLCGSTASFCFSGSFYDPLKINLSGSESGMGQDGGAGTTIKSWTVNPASGGEGITYGLSGTGTQQLTASIFEVTSSTALNVCYTETRYLGPMQTTPFTFGTSSITWENTSLVSQSAVVENAFNHSGSFSSPSYDAIAFHYYHSNLKFPAGWSGTGRVYFIYCAGSDADLFGGGNTYYYSSGNHFHYFCSNSADYGTLTESHPSFSNAAYSLAWKINSSSLHGNWHRSQYQYAGSMIPRDPTNGRSGNHIYPSCSYAYKPTNIVKDPSAFTGFTSEYDSTFEGNKIHTVAINTGSWCPASTPSWYEYMTNPIEQGHPTTIWWLLNLGMHTAPIVCAGTSSYGIAASDTCCIQLNMNRQPTRSFGDHICQSNFGTTVKLSDLPFFNADTIEWELVGNSQGTFLFNDTQSNRPSTLLLDPTTHIKGKVRLCFTASSDNPKCTNDADELPYENTTLTPNCCPAISGCADVYLNPGFSADKNGTHCFPTMSLAGSSPIYNFTDTDVSQPTWSLDGAILQYNDYTLNVITDDADANSAWTNPAIFGAIANLTNSYDTEIHMSPDLDDDNNFGWFTMSLEVSNGPCVFKDTSIQYVAKTITNAGPDRLICIGEDHDGEFPYLPTGPQGFIQAQATGSNGFWTIVAPPGPYSGHPHIFDTTSPTTEVRITNCEPKVELKWTNNSSSTVTIEGEEYGIQCIGSDTVFMEKKETGTKFNILGWSTENSHLLSGDIRYTQSISASHPPGLPGPYGNATGTSIGDQFGRSNQDTLKELHVFGLPPFTTSIHYGASNAVTRDEISFQLDRPLGSFPIPTPDFGDPNRMFKWKDGPGILHGVRLANSESNGGILSQSKEYIPVGINNPSLGEFTSSAFYFSGSNSASYAAASGSGYGSYNKHFYSFGLSGSIENCNCAHIGTQGKIYYHLEVSNLRFVTNPGVVAEVNATKNGMGTILDTNYSHYHTEPTLNVQVPVYKGILALNLMSGSVIKSFTGSSTVYHHQELLNMPAPYLTASVAIRQGIPQLVPARNSSHETGHTEGAPPRSYPPLKYTLDSGFVNNWYPNNRNLTRQVDNQATLVKNFTTENELISYFPYKTGLNAAGYGLNYRWKARELYTYKDTGAGQIQAPSPSVTGSFGDTMTSESFVEAPIFFPALRAYSQSKLTNQYNGFNTQQIRGSGYTDGFESGGDGRHEPYYSPDVGNTGNEKIISQSVMFELTASVTTDEGTILKNYYTSCSVMFMRH